MLIFSSEDSDILQIMLLIMKMSICNSAPVNTAIKKIRLTIDTKDFKSINFFKSNEDKEKLFNYNMNDIIKFFKKIKLKKYKKI